MHYIFDDLVRLPN